VRPRHQVRSRAAIGGGAMSAGWLYLLAELAFLAFVIWLFSPAPR
jgi:hypothetical protein